MTNSDNLSITSIGTSTKKLNKDQREITRNDPRVTLAAKEQRRVAMSKWTMVLVLVCVAAALCIATYIFFRMSEEDDFKRTFQSYASEIRAVSKQHVQTAFLVVEGLSNSITSYVKAAQQTWPNVTVGDYTAHATRTGALSGNGSLVFAPLVTFEDRLGFEEYGRAHVHAQVQENLDFRGVEANATDIEGIHEHFVWFNQGTFVDEPYDGPDVQEEYVINWQHSDFPIDGRPIFTMNNLLRNPTFASAVVFARTTKKAKIGFFDGRNGIVAQIVQPIFQDIYPEHQAHKRQVKGFLWMQVDWGRYFTNILPDHANGTRLVMESSCGFTATYEINGLNSELIGIGDFHDSKYDHLEIKSVFFRIGDTTLENLPSELCADELTLRLYPTDALKESTTTNKPLLYAVAVAGIFIFTSAVFFSYDFAVGRRQRRVMARVITQDKIVSNLFPPTIRDRLYGIGDRMNGASDSQSTSTGNSARDTFDINGLHTSDVYGTKPIADLFLETTVLFADISGFTAWSSAREPSQVFILLENLYGAFDKLSHRHGVFKVETIGDCYVAVTGLPLPNKSHAVVMAKFARDCLSKMELVTSKMEIDLGPDTGDLGLRIGIHSGQVTAGVLRGERSRFQLFGDTVNVASRIENTGESGRIHISSTTSELLKSQGCGKWITPRGDILVRGKGTLFTYWLETKFETKVRESTTKVDIIKRRLSGHSSNQDSLANSARSNETLGDEDQDYRATLEMTKKERLVEWNVETLSGLLKRILAARTKESTMPLNAEMNLVQGKTVLEEFEEIITLPKVTIDELRLRRDPESITLDEAVVEQLRSLLRRTADLYRDNAFHSFEHASHVTASVAKLLSRIVTSDTTMQTHGPDDLDETDLAGHSYGITSDPLTQFTVVFSAIIHDADHPGVPNAQLMKENDPWATKYKGKSLAEQNSVDLVWEVLMQPEYADLRACIYCDEDELKRFRQLLVNVVMATDIADKELGALRRDRWNKAFDPEQAQKDPVDLVVNRKATIVLEHLIQASDVSHTMQHWQVYKKWNQKFFNECYNAWKCGRADSDPSLSWYEGEIGFFDFYIIPLAKKLDSCGVFGVSSHEYLNYALANLEEWKKTGQEVVKEFVRTYDQ